MRPRIFIRGSVRRSVGRSARHSVTLLSKSREIDIFEQISDRGGIQGSPHLFKTVYWLIGLSIHQSVCHAYININKDLMQWRQHEDASLALCSLHSPPIDEEGEQAGKCRHLTSIVFSFLFFHSPLIDGEEEKKSAACLRKSAALLRKSLFAF